MRAFVAIEVNNKDVLNSIHKIQAELNIKAKPVELHNMHFTVQFLGDVSDEMWPSVFVRQIEPDLLPPKGKYLHIKKLLFESNYEFDIFPNKRLWHTALRGKTLKNITKSDYDKFRRNLNESRFLVRRNEIKIPVTAWQRSQGHNEALTISSTR